MAMTNDEFIKLAYENVNLRNEYCCKLAFWDFFDFIQRMNATRTDPCNSYRFKISPTVDLIIINRGSVVMIVDAEDEAFTSMLVVDDAYVWMFNRQSGSHCGYRRYMKGDYIPDVLRDVVARYRLFGDLPECRSVFSSDMLKIGI